MKLVASALLLATGGFLLLCGCASYYQVTDVTTGKTYYSDAPPAQLRSGAIQFRNAGNKAQVTLQNSEVRQITEPEFRQATQPKN